MRTRSCVRIMTAGRAFLFDMVVRRGRLARAHLTVSNGSRSSPATLHRGTRNEAFPNQFSFRSLVESG